MKTITINEKALERISNLIPELNQDNGTVNVNIEFFSFTDVIWTIQNLLEITNDLIIDCSDGDERRIMDISANLVRIAKNLLPIKSGEFLDMLIGEIKHIDESKLKLIQQK